MFVFQEADDTFEKLSAGERGLFLAERSAAILAGLREISVPGVEPVTVLARFLVGSAAADGRINEKEYLMIYPALVRTFGEDFDFASIKGAFRHERARKPLADYVEEMRRVFDALDEALQWDVVILCLCVVSVDGKVAPREKRYIRRLCEVRQTQDIQGLIDDPKMVCYDDPTNRTPGRRR